jgi:hypothetical protein
MNPYGSYKRRRPMKRTIVFLIFLFMLYWMVFPDQNRQQYLLEELTNPQSIAVDHFQIYISDHISVYIYDLKSLRLKNRIGKKGEGPGEFLLDVIRGAEELLIDIQTPLLQVNSLGKLSFFCKKSGSFIRELKSGSRSREFKPLGEGYAGQSMTAEKGIQYRAVNVFDSRLNRVKEVFRVKHHFQLAEGLRVLPASMTFVTGRDRLFVAWEEELIIRVFDQRGNPLYNINRAYDRVKVTESFKKNMKEFLVTDKRYKRLFEMLDIKLIFSPALPAISEMIIDRGKIYVITYRTGGNGSSFTQGLVFDLMGKFLREVKIPLRRMDHFQAYPYTIRSGKLYQLVEEEENWQLLVSRFDTAEEENN